MKKIKKLIIGLVVVASFISTVALAWSLPPTIKKGDLIVATSTTQAVRLATSTAGYVLQIKNGMPQWVATSTLGIGGSGSSATTTINGVIGPTFIFSSPSSTIHISTSTGNIFFDFGSMLISQFTNDSGYIATSTGNWLGTWQSKNPSDFLASSTPIGGGSATTTINGVSGPTFTFNILGTNGLSYSTSSATISLTQATSSAGVSGFLSGTDWSTFNNKQGTISWPLVYASTTHITATTPLSLSIGGLLSMSTSTTAVNGFLAATDFVIFNNKQPLITLNGTAGQITVASTSPTWTFSLATTTVTASSYTNTNLTVDAYGRITTASNGSGGVSTSTPFSAGYIPFATSSASITNSNIYQLGNNIGIGTSTPAAKLEVVGDFKVSATSSLANIIAGVWQGTAIADAHIASAANWNSKATSTLNLTAGAGLAGGGNLTADRTFSVGAGTNIVVNADDVAVTSTPNFTTVNGINPSTWVTTLHDYFIIENPTVTEDDAFMVFNTTSTITKVYAVNKTNTDTVTFNLIHNASRTNATSTSWHLFSTDQTVTATTTPTLITSFASSTVNAGSVMRFYTSAASSSQFTFTIYYTQP